MSSPLLRKSWPFSIPLSGPRGPPPLCAWRGAVAAAFELLAVQACREPGELVKPFGGAATCGRLGLEKNLLRRQREIERDNNWLKTKGLVEKNTETKKEAVMTKANMGIQIRAEKKNCRDSRKSNFTNKQHYSFTIKLL